MTGRVRLWNCFRHRSFRLTRLQVYVNPTQWSLKSFYLPPFPSSMSEPGIKCFHFYFVFLVCVIVQRYSNIIVLAFKLCSILFVIKMTKNRMLQELCARGPRWELRPRPSKLFARVIQCEDVWERSVIQCEDEGIQCEDESVWEKW